MSFVMLVTLKAQAAKFEDLKQTVRAILPDTVAFTGCLGVNACAYAQDHSVTLYERWATPEAQQAYVAWRSKQGDRDGLGAMLREPPGLETREEVYS